MNGRTVFLNKNQVIAPISGYITAINARFGDKVEAGSTLFEIQTRENIAMQQAGNHDNDYGKVIVEASTSGILNEPLNVGIGTYVVEGGVLCSLVDFQDLLVKVNVPYGYHQWIKPGKKCQLFLPDKSMMEGSVYKFAHYQ